MDEQEFWSIVGEIGWPDAHYDAAKRWFMEQVTVEEAGEFREVYCAKVRTLRRVAESDAVCDSWDDTLAHIVGLGEDEFRRHCDEPSRIARREADGEYRESFAYCIPATEDYGLLTDVGYERHLSRVLEIVSELETADADDIPPRLYRQYPGVLELFRLLLAKNWREAVDRYHQSYGAGYADSWPLDSYLIPNFIHDLETFRL